MKNCGLSLSGSNGRKTTPSRLFRTRKTPHRVCRAADMFSPSGRSTLECARVWVRRGYVLGAWSTSIHLLTFMSASRCCPQALATMIQRSRGPLECSRAAARVSASVLSPQRRRQASSRRRPECGSHAKTASSEVRKHPEQYQRASEWEAGREEMVGA